MNSEERIEFIITSAETLAVQLRELSKLREQVRQAQKAMTRQTLPLKSKIEIGELGASTQRLFRKTIVI
jgi:hypothetical protein